MSPHRTKPSERSEFFALGRCRRTGKVRWETRAAARDALKKLRAGGDLDGARLGTYRCARGCQNWHVGHRLEPRA